MLDYFEQLLHADPQRKDSDGDGLLDGYEVLVSHTDPTKADTDGDGRDDGLQVAAAVSSGQTPAVADATADGNAGAGAGAGAAPKDTDGTGISDVEERRLGTSPTKPRLRRGRRLRRYGAGPWAPIRPGSTPTPME